VLGAAPKDRSALYALCDSDEPLVAGAANGVVSYRLLAGVPRPSGRG
jgi:hypothetical protein